MGSSARIFRERQPSRRKEISRLFERKRKTIAFTGGGLFLFSITNRRLLKMDFLEELFKISKRKYQNSGGVFHDKDHKDDDHDDDDDKRRQYPIRSYPQSLAYRPQVTSNPAVFLSSIVCRRCSTQTVQGAKFCHSCGTSIESILTCASCGSKLPVNESLCIQCGYGN